MDTLETIFTRRSIRKFTNKAVDPKLIETLLQAAMSAPSANNQQAWRFIVINDRNVLNEIPKYHPSSQMCLEAQAAIVTCIDPSLEKSKGWVVQDLAAATQNILLAARALGLGAVWLGVYPREDRVSGVKKLFALPENIIPFSIIPIGYTDIEQNSIDRFDSTRIHYNKW